MSGTITITGGGEGAHQAARQEQKIMEQYFKTVMLMYNLIDYSNNYSKISKSL